MKDVNGKLTYKDKEYTLVFNLNVMEEIQDEYGTIDKWAELTDGGSEPNAKAVLFGITAMLNEGIDIENEENGTNIKPFTRKQVGRLLTEVGIAEASEVMRETVIESTQSNEKNA